MSSLEHVVRVSGATARQLDHWVRTGYLRPEGPGGTGNNFHWPAVEVRAAILMKRLVEVGLTPAGAARAARDGCEELAGVLVELERRGLCTGLRAAVTDRQGADGCGPADRPT